MNYEYAYNYWCKTFAAKAKPYWNKADFDKWFLGGAEPLVQSIGYMSTIDNPGSKEHQHELLKASFMAMLDACERGDFSK